MITKELLETIIKWCANNSFIKQALFYGSQSLKKMDEELDSNSDTDFIFIINGGSESILFEGLSEISKDLNVFIHPLVIAKSDLDFKTKIPEYKNALENSIVIYNSDKKV